MYALSDISEHSSEASSKKSEKSGNDLDTKKVVIKLALELAKEDIIPKPKKHKMEVSSLVEPEQNFCITVDVAHESKAKP